MQGQCPGRRIKLAAHPVAHAVSVTGIEARLLARMLRIRNLRDVEVDLWNQPPWAECPEHIPIGADVTGRQNDGFCSAEAAILSVLAGSDAGYDPAGFIFLQILRPCLADDLVALALQAVILQNLAHQVAAGVSFIALAVFFLNHVVRPGILGEIRTTVLASEQPQLNGISPEIHQPLYGLRAVVQIQPQQIFVDAAAADAHPVAGELLFIDLDAQLPHNW